MPERSAPESCGGGQKLTTSDLSVPVISQSATSISSSESNAERREWGRQIEFILTLVGFCVGLGNVWRFPYLCYQNGGGAFLIPYGITLVLVGIPLYYLELILGQFSSLGPIATWTIEPMFKGVGVSMVIVVAYVVCYYNVITAWAMYYLFASMATELPWKHCNNWWNTEACVDSTMNLSDIIINGTINGTKPTTPSEEYYYNNVLRISGGIEYPGSVVWQLCVLLFLAWLIIFLVLIKGVGSVGKAAYFVSLFPYLLLTILLGQAVTLDGAVEGIKFYMYPQWELLADAKAWSEAATQIFYSLGICMGSLIAMASFNKFHYNCQRDALMIPIINCLTSIYAGFVVFSMLGYIAKQKNLDIEDVAKDGPGLVFVVYPEGLATLPVAPLWSTLFFFMMSTLGFSSQFSMAEGVCAAIEDEYDFLHKGNNGLILRGVYCLTNFLLGLPMITEAGFYIFYIMDMYTAGYPLLITALLEIAGVCWIYGFRRVMEDVELMLGKKPNYYWVTCWVGISPAIILGVLIFKSIDQTPLQFEDYVFPDWANAIAWLIVAFPLTWIVGYMLYYHLKHGGGMVCVNNNKPSPDWGPALKENRTGRYSRASQHKHGETRNHDDAIPEITSADKSMTSGQLFTISNLEFAYDDGKKTRLIGEGKKDAPRVTSDGYINYTYTSFDVRPELPVGESTGRKTFDETEQFTHF